MSRCWGDPVSEKNARNKINELYPIFVNSREDAKAKRKNAYQGVHGDSL